MLDADARRRLHANPLRILDSKNPAMQAMIEDAPKLIDFIEDASLAHFDGLQRLLADAGLAYEINPRLVRGLDYYNRTVFEWVATSDELGAQGTVAGGGRYDGLFELVGGKASFACGFAIGVERMILLLRAAGTSAAPAPLAYVVHSGEAAGPLAPARRGNAARCGPRGRRERRRRQFQVADEEGRCEWRAVGAHRRRRRSRDRHGGHQAAALGGRPDCSAGSPGAGPACFPFTVNGFARSD